jgi:hypothetical protein
VAGEERLMCDQDFSPKDKENEEAEDPVVGFYEGWQDILNGNTFPISTLLDNMDEA